MLSDEFFSFGLSGHGTGLDQVKNVKVTLPVFMAIITAL
jgi:hypothetical protein